MKRHQKNKPQLSVVIPTLNEAQFIGLLLNDLTKQTLRSFEVIVSDSSSDDNTLEVAKKFNDKLPLKTTQVKRKSAGHGRNGGAKKAQGEYLVFIDADVRIKSNYLEQLALAAKEKKADFATTRMRADGWHPIDKLIYLTYSWGFRKKFEEGKPLMSGGVMLVRRSIFKDLNGFKDDITVGEDMEFSLRLREKTKKGTFIKALTYTTSNRRFKQDGRIVTLLRNLQWLTGWSLGINKVDNFSFGHYRKKHWLWRWTGRIAWLLALSALIIFAIGKIYAFSNRTTPFTYGVSFSAKYAEELGLDWRTTLERSAHELPFTHYRLMSYWDRVQPNERSVYDFNELDAQLEILAKNNRTATLVVGLRQPRWPECHAPSWQKDLSTAEKQSAEREYIRRVVERYRFDSTITSWQLENESANRLFGDCPEFDKPFHQEKYDLIRSLSNKPISINASNQSGWPLQGPVGQRTGFSIYKEAYFDAFGRSNAWSFWYVPSWWHGFRAAMVEIQHGTTSFVHELQTEPWGQSATVDLAPKVQTNLFPPEELERNVKFAQQTGMRELWLWGVEWWYYQNDTYNNDNYLKVVQQVIQAE